jgi:hypothetical protein
MARAAGDDWWATTVKGNVLANASFGKPISRATAARLLAQVIERARSYNADPARLLTFTEIVVFGSYLDPVTDPLGDLDLAVSTVRRDTGGDCVEVGSGHDVIVVRDTRHDGTDPVLAFSATSWRKFAADAW